MKDKWCPMVQVTPIFSQGMLTAVYNREGEEVMEDKFLCIEDRCGLWSEKNKQCGLICQ